MAEANVKRNCQVGDIVSIVSGPHEGRVGTVTHVRTPEDVLFADAEKSISASLIQEPYAVVRTRLTDFEGGLRDDDVAVPVRRLRPR